MAFSGLSRGKYQRLPTIYTHGAVRVAHIYDNGAMNAKEENCILVEVETYAQELVVHYEREAENYFLMTLEYFSVQRQPKQMSFILNFGESYRESRCFIDTKFK